MSNIKKLKAQARKNAEKKPIEFKAVLGRADGTVKVDAQTVYVTLLNGDVISVFNERVPRVPYRKIIIGYDDRDPSLLQVLRFDNVYSSRPQPNLPNHKDSHTWFGYDPVEVYAQQIMPLLPRAIGGMIVRVYGGDFFCNGADHVLNTVDVDMTAQIPTVGAEWVNVEADENGAITFAHGTNKPSRELLLPTDRPLRSVNKKLLYSAKMRIGMTRFVQTRTDSDIFDPRFTGYASGGDATSIAWADILGIPAAFPPDLTITDDVYPRKWYKSAAPTVIDDISTGFSKSDIWIDQSNGDAYICIDNADGAADWLRVGSGSGDYSFAVDGRLAVATNIPNAFIVTKDVEITACYIYCKAPGTAGNTIVDVNKNGTTIYTTSVNRPTLAFDDANGWAFSIPDILAFAAGDVITLDIDQIATGAEDLVVALSVKGAGSGSGLGLTVIDGPVTINNVGQITFNGLALTDNGGGQIKLARDYILVRDEKPTGTDGGTFTSGAWRLRDLNTEVSDDGEHCLVAGNQITLQSGTYECHIYCPAYSVASTIARLYDVTHATVLLRGQVVRAGSSGFPVGAIAHLVGKFSIPESSVLQIEQWCENTSLTAGFGSALSIAGDSEIYTVAEFWKVG